MVWGAAGDIFSGGGWGRRLVTDRKTSQGALSSTWRALDENFHSPIEASILQGRKSSFWAVNHLMGGHGQGPEMWAHTLHPGGSGCAHPPPRPVMPAADLASWPALPSLPLQHAPQMQCGGHLRGVQAPHALTNSQTAPWNRHRAVPPALASHL